MRAAGFPTEIGPLLERSELFPQHTNVEFVALADGALRARVWERGIGETMACGTGAAAVCVAARLKGFSGDEVRIRVPGGELELAWDGAGEVLMTGPADYVFRGEWLDGQTVLP